jgi:hypothetical protein
VAPLGYHTSIDTRTLVECILDTGDFFTERSVPSKLMIYEATPQQVHHECKLKRLLIAGDPDNNNFAPSRVQNEVVQSELDGVSSLSIRQSTGKIMYLINHNQ